MVLLKTATVHREGSHCLSSLHWISNSHSQMCATPAGKGSTRFHQCSLAPGDQFWEAHTHTTCRVQTSLQRGLCSHAALPSHGTRCYRHALGGNPHSRSSPDLCTTLRCTEVHHLVLSSKHNTQWHRITTLPLLTQKVGAYTQIKN